jgi:hypothetical protein
MSEKSSAVFTAIASVSLVNPVGTKDLVLTANFCWGLELGSEGGVSLSSTQRPEKPLLDDSDFDQVARSFKRLYELLNSEPPDMDESLSLTHSLDRI